MDAHGLEAVEITPASKKLGRDDAKKLIKAATRVDVAKGKNIRSFDGGKASAEVVDALLGPTGNLRAPILRVGKTLLVGFDEASLSATLL